MAEVHPEMVIGVIYEDKMTTGLSGFTFFLNNKTTENTN